MKVAVYGTLRQGGGNDYLLRSSELLSTETLEGWEMRSYGAFPYIYRGDNSIVIEVYEVPDQTVFDRLDGLEGYPNFYNRKLVSTSQGAAWIYFIDYEDNDNFPLVDNGDWFGEKTA